MTSDQPTALEEPVASAPALEFWFEFASTYSYPTVWRIEDTARAAGVPVLWRPFLLGPIFKAQGWGDSPFNIYPVKGRYMWRDLERICADLKAPLRRPSIFPQNGVRASRIAIMALAEERPWATAFIRTVYTANFAEDRDISQAETLSEILAALDQDGPAILQAAQAPSWRQGLRTNTEEAAARGIFGAPTFIVGDELFWGNDRLEHALAWATQPARAER